MMADMHMRDAHGENPDAPDWSTLDFEVTCPRCAYNLAMLAQPRCPECGLQFAWPAVVEASRRAGRESPLFEYRWRNKPFRSFLSTLLLCLMPLRLWRTARLLDTPRPVVLVVWAALIFVLLTYAEWLRMALEATLTNQILNRIPPSARMIWNMLQQIDWSDELRRRAIPLPLLIASVAIYRFTFVRYRIVWRHFFRVAIYAWTTYIAWSLAGSIAVSGIYEANLFFRGALSRNDPLLAQIAVGFYTLPVPAALWSLFSAFRYYLLLPRAWLGAICSMIIVTLAIVVIGITGGVWLDGGLAGDWMRPVGVWIPRLDSLVRDFLSL